MHVYILCIIVCIYNMYVYFCVHMQYVLCVLYLCIYVHMYVYRAHM